MTLRNYILEQIFNPENIISLSDDEDDTLFAEKPSQEKLDGMESYYGKDVVWYAYKGSGVLKVHKDNIHPVFGQIWDSTKLRSVKKFIEQSEDRVHFVMGWGDATITTLDDIKEQQQANKLDRLQSDYELDEPASIGDEELDNYLADPELYVEEELYASDEVIEFVKKNYIIKKNEVFNDNSIIEEFKREYPEYEEEDIEVLEEWLELEEQLYEAVQDGDGDLGEVIVQLRDGNHRSFGAILSGEEYVYVMIEETDPNLDPEIKKMFL